MKHERHEDPAGLQGLDGGQLRLEELGQFRREIEGPRLAVLGYPRFESDDACPHIYLSDRQRQHL